MRAIIILMCALFISVLISCRGVGSYEAKQSSTESEVEGQISLQKAKALSYVLESGMAEGDVVELFGLPTQTALTTCGGDAEGGAWVCRKLTYSWEREGLFHFLLMYFQQVNGAWYLNGWDWLSV